MGLISFPTNVFCRRPLSISPPLRTKSSRSYNPWLNLKSILKRQPQRAQVFNDPLLPLSNQAVVQRGLSLRRKRLPPVVSCSSESTGPREEDNRALEAVQKLYTAIKNKNVKEVSDVIGDECRCFCNFISASQPFHGKKQALEFFDHLMKILGDHASIRFSFTMHDGMAVGVTWRLEWKNNPVPLGTGFSYYVCQEYRGRVVIKNVNMLMDPLIHLGPLRLRIAGIVTLVMDKFEHLTFEGKRKKDIYMFLILSFTFAILFFLITASH
ncbi:hypothetical protein AAG906_015030 [Vitis piasezkii]